MNTPYIKTSEGLPTQSRKRVILCIEGDDDTCELLTLILTRANYEVLHARNAAEGLALAKRGGFDLILLDLYIFDDIELCKQIRCFDRLTPIIFYTAEARDSKKQDAVGAGGQAVLVKPVTIKELLRTIFHYTKGEGHRERVLDRQAQGVRHRHDLTASM